MQVRVSCTHSAFPSYAISDIRDGVSCLQSTMETVAMATLKQCNGLSLWSPRPAPSQNPLFQLIAHHWGTEKATEAMQQILTQRSTPRKPAKSTSSRPSPGKDDTPDGRKSTPPKQSPWMAQSSPATAVSPKPIPSRGLEPSGSELSDLSYDSEAYRYEPSDCSSNKRRWVGTESFRIGLGATMRAKSRKEFSRWGWASWF